MKQVIFSKKHKQNISKGKKGNKLSEEHKRKISEGHHKNDEKVRIRRLSVMAIKKANKKPFLGFKGELNPNWKGGITQENTRLRNNTLEYKLWRKAVYERDLYDCQKCHNSCGGKLQAHHILNFSKYPELRVAIDNGITFCIAHHKEFHHIYGTKNNNKEQIEEYIKS